MLFPDYQKDRYCKFTFNPDQNEYDRDWLHYADGTFEPVRREGNLAEKWTGGPNARVWWHERKPAHWLPWEHGFGFAWNHTLGEEHKPSDWGDKSEAEHRAENTPYFLEIKTGSHGRITQRTERIDGRRETWRFKYDQRGRLTSCLAKNGWALDYEYDDQGCRSADYAVGRSPFMRVFKHDRRKRPVAVDNILYEYGRNGLRTVKQGPEGITRYHYSPDNRLTLVELPGGRLVEYRYDEQGRPEIRLVNGDPVEIYRWRDDGDLAGFSDGRREWEFRYAPGETLPLAVTVETEEFTLEYDQIGSLKAVVNETGTVVKAVQYDPFGVCLWDSNPHFRVPPGFAGGIGDPDTGLIRFGCRDYDPDTGCWTDGSAQQILQRPFELGKFESVARFEQPPGQDELAGEQDLVRHLAKEHAQEKSRGLEPGRTV